MAETWLPQPRAGRPCYENRDIITFLPQFEGVSFPLRVCYDDASTGKKRFFALLRMDFSDHLFWDVDAATFDLQKGRRLVLQRVLSLGTLQDVRTLKKIYPLSMVRKVVLEIRDWEPQVLNFISIWLDIPKENFACCTSRPSHPKHWG